MAETTTGDGADTRGPEARDLIALAELADMLWELGSESIDAPIDVAPYLDGLKAVGHRIHRMKPLDADGRERAAKHYYAGVLAGAWGDDSAIACGVAGSLARQAGNASRSSARCFAALARIGRRHGRAFAAHGRHRVHV
ncbi:hypothetical protein ACVBGC_33440 [Burkholderia stagnalis]